MKVIMEPMMKRASKIRNLSISAIVEIIFLLSLTLCFTFSSFHIWSSSLKAFFTSNILRHFTKIITNCQTFFHILDIKYFLARGLCDMLPPSQPLWNWKQLWDPGSRGSARCLRTQEPRTEREPILWQPGSLEPGGGGPGAGVAARYVEVVRILTFSAQLTAQVAGGDIFIKW